jgi:sec-independent protein translocase protein TatA
MDFQGGGAQNVCPDSTLSTYFWREIMGLAMSVPQLLIILVIVALIFGTKRLKTIGADLGGALKSFRKAMNTGGTHDNPLESPKRLTRDEASK